MILLLLYKQAGSDLVLDVVKDQMLLAYVGGVMTNLKVSMQECY